MTSYGPRAPSAPILVIRATPSTLSASFLQLEAGSSGPSVAPPLFSVLGSGSLD